MSQQFTSPSAYVARDTTTDTQIKAIKGITDYPAWEQSVQQYISIHQMEDFILKDEISFNNGEAWRKTGPLPVVDPEKISGIDAQKLTDPAKVVYKDYISHLVNNTLDTTRKKLHKTQ